jgi:hypothetical protein
MDNGTTKNYQFGWDKEINFPSQKVGDNGVLTAELRMFQGKFCIIFRHKLLQLDDTIKERTML